MNWKTVKKSYDVQLGQANLTVVVEDLSVGIRYLHEAVLLPPIAP